VSKAIRGRDGFTRHFGRDRYENLFGAISWLTFLRAEQLTPGEDRAISHGAKMERGKTAKVVARVSAASTSSLPTLRAARPIFTSSAAKRRARDALMPVPAPMIKALQ
jgi:hypothetical protein